MQSLNNQSNIPLRANAIYIGSWDDILKYQNVQITLNADTNCEITYYTSNDKVFIENQTFAYNANDNYYNSINSTSRYVYFTVRNLQNVNQTQFNFSVLYKDYPVSSGGGIGKDVNIINPLNQDGSVFVGGNLALTGAVDANITNALLDVSDADTHTKLDSVITDLDKFTFDNLNNVNINLNNLNSNFIDAGNNNGLKVAVQNSSLSVSVSNFPETQAVSNGSLSSMSFNTNRLNVLDSDANTKLTNIYNIVNSRGSVQMINGLINTAVELPNVKSCTIYGNVSGATVLTLKFSPNGIDYYSSQYSVNMTGAGDFGFVINGLCAKWIMFNNSNSVNAVAFVDYC